MFPCYLYGPDSRLQHDIAGELGSGARGHIVGTYDQNGAASNQRPWLNGVVKAEATVSGALQVGGEGMGIGGRSAASRARSTA